MDIGKDSTIAVIGAGAMGSGIAQVAAAAGHGVIVVDPDGGALERSRTACFKAFDRLVGKGALDPAKRDAMLARLDWSPALEAAAPAALVIEAIVEDAGAKAQLFANLEAIVAPAAALATNTSSLSVAALAARLGRPERFLGLHFFNPVPAMRLVEVVAGPRTSRAVRDGMRGLIAQWGKVAVEVRDVPGFIVNRVARPYYAEAFAALDEGIPAAAIDHLLQSAGGFRMGPLALTDLIGQDVNYAVAESIYAAYDGATRFRPQPAQRALVAAATLGRKTGTGVYDHGAELPRPAFVAPGDTGWSAAVSVDRRAIEPVIAAIRAAAIELSEDPELPADSLRIGHMVMALGDGRPLSSRVEVDVLLDHARDFAAAPVWGISARNHAAAAGAASFAAAIGKKVIAIPDRPGQLVLKTLAQLANAAADAVADDVASAADIDAAMRFGANHPEGPLGWAERVGYGRVAGMLRTIAAATGDPLYRPSAFWERG